MSQDSMSLEETQAEYRKAMFPPAVILLYMLLRVVTFALVIITAGAYLVAKFLKFGVTRLWQAYRQTKTVGPC